MSSDAHLQDQVLAELKWDPRVNAAHIGITAHNGVVTLTGRVPTYFEKLAAEKAAGRVRHVKAVAMEITVIPPLSTQTSDETIALAALNRLSWNSYLPQDAIKVGVEKGWVTLTGAVDEYFQKIAAEADITSLRGVVGLTNKTQIKPRIDTFAVTEEIRRALDRSWFFSPRTVDVSVVGGNICLSGKVETLHDRKLATAIAWAAPGVTSVDDKMLIA